MSEAPASPPAGAIPLREAVERFSPTELWRAYQRKSAQRRALQGRSAGPLLSDDDTAPEARAVHNELNRLRRQIKQVLVDRLIAGELVAWGQAEPPFGPWRPIPAAAWQDLQIKDIRRGRVFGPSGDLGGVHILKAEGAAAAAHTDRQVPGTGAPGRPSAMHKVAQELQRRAEAGRLEPSLNRQAQVLAEWLTATHPDLPPATAKTIANRLREAYRAAAQSS